MKKVNFLLLIACVFSISAANAQYRDHAVKLNAFGIFVGQIQLGYEMALNDKFSAQLSAGILTGSSDATLNGTPLYEGKRTGVIVIPEARYYFDEALHGFYASAFFRYRQSKWDIDAKDFDTPEENWSYERTRTAVGGGMTLGYQIVAGTSFVIDIFLGPQIKSVSKKTEYDVTGIDEDDESSIDLSGIESDGVGARFGVNIGYTF